MRPSAKAVGDDFSSASDSWWTKVRSGFAFEECVRAALILKQAGAVDFVNAIYGTMDTIRALAEENMPGMGSRLAPWVELVGAFRREVALPVFHAARISDVASARFAVAEGKLDTAGMTRAQIADPYLVQKLTQGRESEIRPCVGATHCQSLHKPSCLHNAATGRELTLSQSGAAEPAAQSGYVGGGPAGLEAARGRRAMPRFPVRGGERAGGQIRTCRRFAAARIDGIRVARS